MTLNINNFFDGPFFDGPFFDAGIPIGGHGAGEGADGDRYEEPRRVTIAGKPYTVRSKGEYLALLRRYGRKEEKPAAKPKAAKQAEAVIARAQEQARDSVSALQTAEIAALLQAKMKKDALLIAEQMEAGIPIEILMMVASEL